MAVSEGIQITKDVELNVYCRDCEESLTCAVRQSLDGDTVDIYVDPCSACQRERDGDD